MKILICNDDGIDSLGISILADQMKKLGEVTVVAPRTEQSAVGHAITMKIPVRVNEYYKNGDLFGYAVDGTPADCVKMGIRNIMKTKPDIVISGINQGSNAAINIIYSGTVSAAREAAIMDVPAIAISVTSHDAKKFDYAAEVALELAQLVVKNGLPKGTCLNINVPDKPANEIAGILLTKQGTSKWDDVYEQRKDPYGKNYFWLTGNLIETDNDLDTDYFAIKNNFVAVTPIHFDLTDYKTYDFMKSWRLSDIFEKLKKSK